VLRELSSDLPGFKPVLFAPGLNVAVLDGGSGPGRPAPLEPAERPVIPGRRGQHATVGYTPLGEQWARSHAAGGSRPGSGSGSGDDGPGGGGPQGARSRLVMLLDFVLGGTGTARDPGHRQELARSAGTLRLAVGGEVVTATRHGDAPGDVTVHSDAAGAPPWSIRLAEWQQWLGRTLFGLRGEADEPSYRSLVSYYLRDADHGGFLDPIRHHARQPTVESLPPLAHLFGLDAGLVEAAKTLHASRRHLRSTQRSDADLPAGQRTSDAAAGRDLANLTAEIATLELERAEAGAAASWRTARASGSALAADPYAVTAALDQRLVELRARRDALARYADAHAELQRQALELRDSVRADLRGRHDRLTAASNLFTRYAYDLFGPSRPAALTVAARDSGYAFYPVLGGDPAPGVPELTLFCFDLAMAVAAYRAGTGPDFLVHDAHLFDRLSPELAAGALDLASRVGAVEGIQYLAAIDADLLARIHAYDPAISYHECATLHEQ
jgi:uncharacterized protein YydD (DUF2326 family)